MRKNLLAFVLVWALHGSTRIALSIEAGPEVKSFGVQPGDTLAINNDFGKIRIRSWEGTALEVQIQKTIPDQTRKNSLEVASSRSGSTVFIYTFFSGAPGEAVDLEIRAPKFINVMIWGANPEVDIGGIQGVVRVQDFTGRITAEDLTSASSLITDKGDIIYRTSVQPQGDVRLESTSGNVYCELGSRLNMRGWIRAGGKISWDKEAPLQSTFLEKQMGTFGPLLYAGSLKGNVEVQLKESVGSAGVASSQAVHVNPKPLPEASRPLEQRTPAPASSAPEVRREPSPGEGQQPVLVQGGYALKVNVDSVFLNVSVRDRSTSRSIPSLQKDDFRIYEDGVKQQIDQFLPTEAPFNLLLLLDVSGSTQSYLHLMKQAAIDFTRQIKANDRVAVATFNSRVQLVQDFTGDRAAAERAINRIQSGGGTAFYDALMTCVNQYMRNLQGRSAIVVFTDGVDNQLEGNSNAGSRTTYDELFRRIQEIDTIIYTIFLDTEGQVPAMTQRRPGGIGGWPGGRRGRFPGSIPFPIPQPTPNPTPRRQQNQRAIYEEARDQLQEIAEQTGGRMYSPHKIGELSSVYSEIADDLRIQYQLGYNSTNRAQDGQWRTIRVMVETHPEAEVRTRKGYYARREGTE